MYLLQESDLELAYLKKLYKQGIKVQVTSKDIKNRMQTLYEIPLMLKFSLQHSLQSFESLFLI